MWRFLFPFAAMKAAVIESAIMRSTKVGDSGTVVVSKITAESPPAGYTPLSVSTPVVQLRK
jgi:hypothetical protein